MSVKDAVAALDARKAGLAMPPPVKPPMPTKPTDGTVTPPIFDPTGGKGTGAPTLPGGGTQTPPIMAPPTTKPPMPGDIDPNSQDTEAGTVTPPIYPGPTGPPGAPPGGGAAGGGAGGPALPPVMPPAPERMAAFDFSPFEGKAGYHEDPAFQKGWDNVFSALGGMDPETRARAEEAMAGMGPIEAGGARGMNAWIQAINKARGFEDQDPAATEAGTLPPGTNPPPPVAGTSAETSGMTAAGTNPLLAPPPEAMAAALGEAGMQRGGRRPRPGTNPRPTLPNESGQRPGRGRRGDPYFDKLREMGASRADIQSARASTTPGQRKSILNSLNSLNGGKAVVADESRQWQPRKRAPNPRNPRAGGY